MAIANWTEADSNRAHEIWAEYQRGHDLSEKTGQTTGIDPASGRLWFGESIQDVIALRDAAGSAAPLFFVRVGSATYYRKKTSSEANSHPGARRFALSRRFSAAAKS